MLLKSITAVAAGLLAAPAAHAFLLPPEVSEADVQIANTLEAVAPQVADIRHVDIECPGCPILVRGPRGKRIQLQIDQPSHLQLSFNIEQQSDVDRLLVNGFELYPSGDPLLDSLWAAQIVDQDAGGQDREKRHHDEDDNEDEHHEHHRRPNHLIPQPQRLGFGLHVSSGKKDGEFELVEVELQVIEVGVAFVDGIPSVKIQLIKDDSGRLVIAQIEKGAPKKLLGATPQECTTMMCKMIAMAREKLKGMRPFKNCHGGNTKGGMESASGEVPPHHHHHHHGHGHGGGQWRAPYRKHSWGQLFKNIASHIILPVLIGIVAGVSISL
jgi:hypothetical protein